MRALGLFIKQKKKNYKSIGCASTGNMAISMAFFAKIYNIKSKIWFRKQDINAHNLNLVKSLGGKVFIKKTNNLSDLYDFSSRLMIKNKVFNANPYNSNLK